MTRRPRLLTTATAGAMAALLLAGCGGGGDGGSKGNDKIAGADTGGSASASPSASASAAAGRPKISFPSDAKNVFEETKTGDPTKDAVLADSALSVNSVDEAIFKGSASTKALGFYNTGKALDSSITYVQGYIKDKDTWIGETRYFDRKVTLSGAKEAYVTYCSDESKSFIKNKKTKKVDRTPTTSNAYVLYHTTLAKNADGVWQTTNIVSNRGDKACQP
ncbi:hypothetical protein [Streptomyces sp. NPDC001480]|uniref:hypothetical protein n=1 Tax=Streptomyces sp. NPDC001480 TaxID=3364577 RepID=UPI00369C3D7E